MSLVINKVFKVIELTLVVLPKKTLTIFTFIYTQSEKYREQKLTETEVHRLL